MPFTLYPQVKQEVFQGASPGRGAGRPTKAKVASETSTPTSIGNSLHFDLDLDEPLAFVHKSSIAIAKSRLNQGGRQRSGDSLNVAIQTDREVDVENDLGINVVPPGKRKFDLLSSDPLFFLPCDDHVRAVSQKWYKSIKKLVRHLLEVLDVVDAYKDRRELISARVIFVWICENIRYDPAFQEHQVLLATFSDTNFGSRVLPQLTTIDILRYRAGVCREFVKLFEEMCQVLNLY